ncbi:signal peptide peptidase SppA [Sphingomonas jatrophae]|uniref:Protease-4 n=1 Tax=Sphingomonas jatrophae TaxID=1166337 RepID=A0A1I6LIZ7_9SPHN|nr:signal peptide peptidase SppA [Sphingomonas jatrophae]SFS03381.1 protease-4 [Sphingomonas jatrophae]
MRFLKGIWKLLVGVKDGLVLLFMLLFFGVMFAALSRSPNPRLPASGALVLDLRGSLVEQPEDADPFEAVSGSGPLTREYRLRDVIRAVDGAARDASIKAVVLDLDRFTGGGQTAIASLGEALDRVRRTGKPVLAFATGYTDDSYQLAAHATEVWLDPLGAVLLTGPGGSRLYYKGLLDKLGVTANVYRVGTYKSAVEPFTRTDASPEAKAADQALVDALWGTWRAEVSQARPKANLAAYLADPEAVARASGGNVAQAAQAAAMVDRLGDRIAFGRRVAALAGASTDKDGDGYQAIGLANWLSANPVPEGQVGVLTIAGEIVDGETGPGRAGGETIARLVLQAVREKRIRALVVRVDSPGGSVTASERIRGAIMTARAAGMPVAVSMGNVAASGGYWVSTPGQRIFAEPSTITGSIGVFGIIPTFAGTLEKVGLSADGVATTPLSGQPDVLRGTSPQFDRLVQLGIEDIYGRFIGLVAQARRLPVARVDEIGQGRVWAGGTARQIGLVDQFGGLDDAIAWAAGQAKLSGGSARPLFIEKEPSAWRGFLRDLLRRERGDGQGGDASVGDAWSMLASRPERAVAQAIGDARAIAAGPAIQVRCLQCGGSGRPVPPRDMRLWQLLLARIGA